MHLYSRFTYTMSLNLLPRFTYMMNEETHDLSEENQNFMWRLEGILHEDHIFFLKVTVTDFRNKSWKRYFSRSPGRPEGADGFSSSR